MVIRFEGKVSADQIKGTMNYTLKPISVEWDLTFNGNQAVGTLYYSFDEVDGEGELEVDGVRVK